jgi:hypothetical protein
MKNSITCTPPNIIRVIKRSRVRWAGHIARVGELICAYKILLGKPEERTPLRGRRRRWEDDIKMNLREMGLK